MNLSQLETGRLQFVTVGHLDGELFTKEDTVIVEVPDPKKLELLGKVIALVQNFVKGNNINKLVKKPVSPGSFVMMSELESFEIWRLRCVGDSAAAEALITEYSKRPLVASRQKRDTDEQVSDAKDTLRNQTQTEVGTLDVSNSERSHTSDRV